MIYYWWLGALTLLACIHTLHTREKRMSFSCLGLMVGSDRTTIFCSADLIDRCIQQSLAIERREGRKDYIHTSSKTTQHKTAQTVLENSIHTIERKRTLVLSYLIV